MSDLPADGHKLDINPLIRAQLDSAPLIEATEEQIKRSIWMKKPRQTLLFLRGGLVNTDCFPWYYGAFFVLNCERYLDGLLSEEQLDRFVRMLLSDLNIPCLKAIHPQADIEGLVTGLLRERRLNTREILVREDIDQFGRLPSWSKSSRLSFDPSTAIIRLVTKAAPFAIALGHDPATVLEQLMQELGKAVDQLYEHPALKRPFFDRYLDHFLIGYPELWSMVGADATRFLGEPMIKKYPGEGFSADKAVVNTRAGRLLFREGEERYGREMADLILDYLQGFDPGLFDAGHLLLDGTRSQAWLDRCTNLESGLITLERLLAHGVVHPALKRLDGVAKRLSNEGRQGVIREYLRHGSKVTEKLTRAIIELVPELHEWAFEQCVGHAEILRLREIQALSPEQIGRLDSEIKRRILEADMGV